MPPRKGDKQKIAGAGGLHEMKATLQIERGRAAKSPHIPGKSNQRTSSTKGRNKEMGRYRDRQGETRVSVKKPTSRSRVLNYL